MTSPACSGGRYRARRPPHDHAVVRAAAYVTVAPPRVNFTHPAAVALPYESLAFLTGAASLRGLPEDDGREAAFAGRSNAGKSSALNAVAGRRALARTSKTPGRTREINFFCFASGQRLADLPGYGFARAPADARQRWAALVEAYLQRRRSLVGVVLLMDVRRPLTDLDWQMVRWCDASRVPVHAVLTKADKLGRGAASAALRSVRESLASLAEPAGAQLLSATRGDGLDALRGRLDSWLDPIPESREDAVGS